jgi:hypothetical protein
LITHRTLIELQVGTIRWPLRLQDNAADLDYCNDAIQTPLYDAYSAVFDILTGTTPHPIMIFFREHMKEQRITFHKRNRGRAPSEVDLFEMVQHLPFSVPVLPGDASLVENFVADIKVQANHEKIDIIDEDLVLIPIGSILFHLVILRTYLGRPAENDLDIYELVKARRVSRTWTAHEQALAACYGEDDTSSNACFRSVPDPHLWKVSVIKVSSDMEVPLSQDRPFVSIQPQNIVWTNRPGLMGGTRKPRQYRPPYIRLAPPGLRPRPRPAYTGATTTEGRETSGDTLLSSKRHRDESDDEDAKVEIPVKKRRIAKRQALVHTPEDDHTIGISNSPAQFRRGTRSRTAAKF